MGYKALMQEAFSYHLSTHILKMPKFYLYNMRTHSQASNCKRTYAFAYYTNGVCAFMYPFISQNTYLYNPLTGMCYVPLCAQSLEDMSL